MKKYGMGADLDRLNLEQQLEEELAVRAAGEEGEESDEQSLLYGDWQTIPWIPAVAVNGLVPKNSRGHVDLWDSSHLPGGCTHLPYPRIASMARKLGIDYADAMVGFEVKHGRSLPKFNGIVVVTETADQVLTAYLEREKEIAEREEKKRMDSICFNWKRLVRGSIIRYKVLRELERTHGVAGGGGIEIGKTTTIAKKEGKKKSSSSSSSSSSLLIPTGGLFPTVANDLNHVHDYTFNKTMNLSTGTWMATCRCGARTEYEEL